MDHKWGRNVVRYGLGDIGATLCSRRTTHPANWIITNSDQYAPNVTLAIIPPDMESPPAYAFIPVVKFQPYFPYGYEVEADEPV